MKHNIPLIVILISMFLVTQLLGLWVVNYYSQEENQLPYGLEPPEVTEENALGFLVSLLIAFALAVILVFILMNIKSVWVMRVWFFLVVVLALGITLNAFGTKFSVPYTYIIAGIIALILASLKVFKRNILVHNITELMIHPGIAAVFVPILNIWTIILLLIAISIYDIWAVWHSKVMQKMAKFQINKLRVFSGFFVPYATADMRKKIKALKSRYKDKKKIPESALKKQKVKVNLAILGGGDIIFPIIAAGVFLKSFNSMIGALIVTLFATLALIYLYVFGRKRKYYPAMPFLTTGIFLGMIVAWLVLRFLI